MNFGKVITGSVVCPWDEISGDIDMPNPQVPSPAPEHAKTCSNLMKGSEERIFLQRFVNNISFMNLAFGFLTLFARRLVYGITLWSYPHHGNASHGCQQGPAEFIDMWNPSSAQLSLCMKKQWLMINLCCIIFPAEAYFYFKAATTGLLLNNVVVWLCVTGQLDIGHWDSHWSDKRCHATVLGLQACCQLEVNVHAEVCRTHKQTNLAGGPILSKLYGPAGNFQPFLWALLATENILLYSSIYDTASL